VFEVLDGKKNAPTYHSAVRKIRKFLFFNQNLRR
jgi:hypothetical protein